MLTRTTAQAGSGLVEAMIAMLITTVVILGLSGLVLQGTRLQQASRSLTAATSLGFSEVERLRVLGPGAAARQLGGSLTEDVADHFRVVTPTLTTRWVIAAGPVGTRDLTMRVVSTDPGVRTADVTVRLYP
jgi:Tfp pilus assembly protein PilV